MRLFITKGNLGIQIMPSCVSINPDENEMFLVMVIMVITIPSIYCCLLCVRNSSKYFTCSGLFGAQSSLRRQAQLLVPFYRWKA